MARVKNIGSKHIGLSVVLLASLLSLGAASPGFAASRSSSDAGVPDCAADGVTDDIVCLQHALNDRHALRLASGHVYYIGKSLILNGPNSIDGNQATITTKSAVPVLTVRGDGAQIRNLEIKGSGARNTDGIMIDNRGTNVAIQNNQINGFLRAGITFGGPDQHDILIQGNTIRPGNGGRISFGILVNPQRLMHGVGAPPRGITIRNNVITDVSSDAIEINSPPPTIASNVTIEGNTLSAPNHQVTASAGFCVGMSGARDVRIVRNRMSDCKWQGIHIENEASNILIVGNTINGTIGPVNGETAWSKNSSGILLQNTNGIRIYKNDISNIANNGIDLGWNPKGANTNIYISGNTITDARDFGIHVGGPHGKDIGVRVGDIENYGPNTITRSGKGDFSACTKVQGSDSRRMLCGNLARP